MGCTLCHGTTDQSVFCPICRFKLGTTMTPERSVALRSEAGVPAIVTSSSAVCRLGALGICSDVDRHR